MAQEPTGIDEKRIGPRTYMSVLAVLSLVVLSGFGVWYFFLDNSEGCPSTPDCELQHDSEPEHLFTILNPSFDAISWTDVTITLEAVPVDSYPTSWMRWVWSPVKENLTGLEGQTLTATQSILYGGYLDYPDFCNVTDIKGDGLFGDGDYFTIAITDYNSDLVGASCTLRLMYEDTDGSMCTLEFNL